MECQPNIEAIAPHACDWTGPSCGMASLLWLLQLLPLEEQLLIALAAAISLLKIFSPAVARLKV